MCIGGPFNDKNQSASTEFGQKTVIDKMKIETILVFLVGSYLLRPLCKSELPGNRGSKEGNAEAQSSQLSQPGHGLTILLKVPN